jgi:peptide deformylase
LNRKTYPGTYAPQLTGSRCSRLVQIRRRRRRGWWRGLIDWLRRRRPSRACPGERVTSRPPGLPPLWADPPAASLSRSAWAIVTVPDSILTKGTHPIPESMFATDELVDLVGQMRATLDECGGLGLAAPQVGESLRLFVMRDYPDAFCNPEVIAVLDDEEVVDLEGCLSLPGVRVNVSRVKRIRVMSRKADGAVRSLRLQNMDARVFQHELDHLDGVLITDRVSTG